MPHDHAPPPTDVCLRTQQLVALLDGELGLDDEGDLRAHARRCPDCGALLSTLLEGAEPEGPAALEPGVTVGAYRIERLLGRGGFGAVYAAHDEELDRRVALKVLDGGAGGDAAAALLEEAKLLARLHHPNVATVFGVEAAADGAGGAIAMELIDGETLRRSTPRGTSWRRIVELYLQAAEGLSAVHAAGLAHGDFKPDNALVDGRGRVAVVDFGLARPASKAGGEPPVSRGGTPAYMAPEQIAGAPASPLADQYSFARSLAETLQKAAGHAPANDDVIDLGDAPAALRPVLARALREDPAQRWPAMSAFADAIRSHLSVVDRMRINAGLGSVVAVVALLSVTTNETDAGWASATILLSTSALLLSGLMAFGHRSHLLARFCRSAGAFGFVALLLALIPMTASFVGPAAALGSFATAQLLTITIVAPAFSRRSEVCVLLGFAAFVGYLLAAALLAPELPASTVWPRAALLLATGFGGWLLSGYAERAAADRR